jgi:hypothetical protein
MVTASSGLRSATVPKLEPPPTAKRAGSGTMNCAFANAAEDPLLVDQFVKGAAFDDAGPCSNTRMRVALRTVASRCAITKVVRPFITSLSAAFTCLSVVASSALVTSSRIKIGGFFRSARAIESRWRSPPDRARPRSPTMALSPPS